MSLFGATIVRISSCVIISSHVTIAIIISRIIIINVRITIITIMVTNSRIRMITKPLTIMGVVVAVRAVISIIL